jgi:hypothetical protein
MADNLALKLLVAGIVGAVIGAALAERYGFFPSGLVNTPRPYRTTRRVIDPSSGSGRADLAEERVACRHAPPCSEWAEVEEREDGRRVVLEPPPDCCYPPRYRPPPRRPVPRTTWCWREFEDWNFRTTGHFVRCPADSAGRRERDDI